MTRGRTTGIAAAWTAAALVCALAGVDASAAEERYERPGTLRASELLPPELLKGPHHAVEEEVSSDGMVHTFGVRSGDERFEARGEAALRARIREIEALAALREARPAGDAPTGAGLPIGTWPRPGEREAGSPLAGARERFVDVEGMKRQIALRLGIDPHTANPQLQEELARHAWAAYAGGVDSPFAEGAAEDAEGGSDRVSTLLRDYDAEDLRRWNRIELAVMGVAEPLREKFVSHPAYTPQSSTSLVEALAALEQTADRNAFVEKALEADSRDDALSYTRLARMLRRFAERGDGLDRFVDVDGRIAAYAEDGTLVVPVVADRALWTRPVASFAESVARASGDSRVEAHAQMLFSGTLSPRARRELQALGISILEGGGEAGSGEAESGGAPDEGE